MIPSKLVLCYISLPSHVEVYVHVMIKFLMQDFLILPMLKWESEHYLQSNANCACAVRGGQRESSKSNDQHFRWNARQVSATTPPPATCPLSASPSGEAGGEALRAGGGQANYLQSVDPYHSNTNSPMYVILSLRIQTVPCRFFLQKSMSKGRSLL